MSLTCRTPMFVCAVLCVPRMVPAQMRLGALPVDTARISRIFAKVSAPSAPGCAVGVARSGCATVALPRSSICTRAVR